jgi:transcription elongation GreA/GreB family factor
VGSALMDHLPGDEVTVKAPSGTMRFKLIEVID